jgi:methionyl aminopeptidase
VNGQHGDSKAAVTTGAEAEAGEAEDDSDDDADDANPAADGAANGGTRGFTAFAIMFPHRR